MDLRAWWPTSLANQCILSSVRDPVSKSKVDEDTQHQALASTYMCTQTNQELTALHTMDTQFFYERRSVYIVLT